MVLVSLLYHFLQNLQGFSAVFKVVGVEAHFPYPAASASEFHALGRVPLDYDVPGYLRVAGYFKRAVADRANVPHSGFKHAFKIVVLRDRFPYLNIPPRLSYKFSCLGIFII